MCTPYQWHLRVTLRYEVLKQRMVAASATSHHYWCGAARVEVQNNMFDSDGGWLFAEQQYKSYAERTRNHLAGGTRGLSARFTSLL